MKSETTSCEKCGFPSTEHHELCDDHIENSAQSIRVEALNEAIECAVKDVPEWVHKCDPYEAFIWGMILKSRAIGNLRWRRDA